MPYWELEAKWIENVDRVILLHPKCTAYINSHFKSNTCQFTGLGEYYNRDSNSPDKFKSEFKEFPVYVQKVSPNNGPISGSITTTNLKECNKIHDNRS